MKSELIILSSKFNRSISTRAAIENLFKNLIADEVVIDFSDIYYISGSAAHQIITEIKFLEKKNVKVSCEHMNDDVSRMLELSKTDRKNIFTVPSFIKHSVVRSESDLSELLLDSI